MPNTPSAAELTPLVKEWLIPEWPAPANVKAFVTTRAGALSAAPYDGLNFAKHVGDDPDQVEAIREALKQTLGLDRNPQWINQVHGVAVVEAGSDNQVPDADASFSGRRGQACTVLTADCLPVFFCDRAGTRVAVAHAGWKGLCDGMLEATVQALFDSGVNAGDLLAWIGPGIGPASFEVGAEVRDAFVARDANSAVAFQPRADKWLGDLYLMARQRLNKVGVTQVFGGGFDTFTDPRFYSFRRDAITGRFLSIIWLD